jgi:hypothetical protein
MILLKRTINNIEISHKAGGNLRILRHFGYIKSASAYSSLKDLKRFCRTIVITGIPGESSNIFSACSIGETSRGPAVRYMDQHHE